MILCAGLSPAWQHTLFFNRLQVGEVNRARRGVWCASGKVVNTAVALASLGVEHRMLTVAGGWPEAAFRSDLAATGVAADLVSVRSPTRVCTTLLVEGQPTTELVEESLPLADSEVDAFSRRFAEQAKAASAVIIAGSMPKGVDRSLWRRLLQKISVPVVLDIRGPELLDALATKPLLVKPNREELAATVGSSLHTEDDVVRAGRELCDRGACWVLVTHGVEPGLLLSASEVVRVRGAEVQAVNPIGCGDTLAATIAWRASAGDQMPEAVPWGVAAAAANAESELPARFRKERAHNLLAGVVLEAPAN